MSENENSDDVPVRITPNREIESKSTQSDEQEFDTTEEIKTEENTESEPDTTFDENMPELNVEQLQELLSKEKQKVAQYEEKLKHSLADFQNLKKKIQSDIENEVQTKIDYLMLDLLEIYDDFTRAQKIFSENDVKTEGIESILKNMNSLLTKYHVAPIQALGEIFDPNLHEAISVIEDPELEDGTITKEIRKGYISQGRIIRPTLVEVSKKK